MIYSSEFIGSNPIVPVVYEDVADREAPIQILTEIVEYVGLNPAILFVIL